MMRSAAALGSAAPSSFKGARLFEGPTRNLLPARSQSLNIQSSSVFPQPPSVKGRLGPKYAVVEVGGAQQIVEEGLDYTCHRLNVPAGSLIKLPRVLAAKYDGSLRMGDPYLEDVNVEAEIMEEYRAPKIMVYRYRPKKHYRKIKGHRQPMTRFKVTKIDHE